MGASRLARFAIDDEKRMKIVEIGGAQQLLNMLEFARDDRTRKESLKALFAISNQMRLLRYYIKLGLYQSSIPLSSLLRMLKLGNKYKSNLLIRFQNLSYADLIMTQIFLQAVINVV
ncbi:uncharacterized protein [Solanum tuberosum]|uniref:uncharacterized protein isoform X2 n=1 Tax=Solanum tuberosum TaxID=4113 RepID=UPI00073A1766|nr:PREDICTED: uncharacterized protein LOC102584269 isoform X2 [Solanum tuberosum]